MDARFTELSTVCCRAGFRSRLMVAALVLEQRVHHRSGPRLNPLPKPQTGWSVRLLILRPVDRTALLDFRFAIYSSAVLTPIVLVAKFSMSFHLIQTLGTADAGPLKANFNRRLPTFFCPLMNAGYKYLTISS